MEILGGQALERLLELDDVRTVLDIGSGAGLHAQALRAQGREVTTISLEPGADYVGDFLSWPSEKRDFDAVWACHVLEHQVNPGLFLAECRRRLRPGGYLAVTVPPAKQGLVGGHVTLWNAGLLLYQLVMAGFDCRNARVGTYGYNISVIVPNEPAELPALTHDAGDLARLAKFFPVPIGEGADGVLADVRWGEAAVLAAPWPRRIAILGLGPSLEEFVRLTKRAGGAHVLYDEVWGINAVGGVIACDRVFHMDDVRIQEIRAQAKPDSNIAGMLQWMRKHPGPIITSRTHPDYPGLVAFPLEELLNTVPHAYLNSTAAYAVASAVTMQGVEKIGIYGMDFTYPNAHDAEKGRACVEFWLGVGVARGIKIALPKVTSLMDACEKTRLYGYDTLDVTIGRKEGAARIAVEFTEKAGPLPTAQEMESRYDHTRHPSPLMEEGPAVDDGQFAALVELGAFLKAEADRHRESGRVDVADKCERFAGALAPVITEPVEEQT
jgi:SAM-dependent methyltransferase